MQVTTFLLLTFIFGTTIAKSLSKISSISSTLSAQPPELNTYIDSERVKKSIQQYPLTETQVPYYSQNLPVYQVPESQNGYSYSQSSAAYLPLNNAPGPNPQATQNTNQICMCYEPIGAPSTNLFDSNAQTQLQIQPFPVTQPQLTIPGENYQQPMTFEQQLVYGLVPGFRGVGQYNQMALNSQAPVPAQMQTYSLPAIHGTQIQHQYNSNVGQMPLNDKRRARSSSDVHNPNLVPKLNVMRSDYGHDETESSYGLPEGY